ncbi:hypothetical protein [Vibrio vulnificus YJ016]|uniref:Uncharacterized protein n=1 Tax=Vibrio vulnificus (strain YJ016) TaxID=196600 RepID=Q7MM48_VIBVY|nr:hypothetical protein [Vibrio vulnificus YJ016]
MALVTQHHLSNDVNDDVLFKGKLSFPLFLSDDTRTYQAKSNNSIP